MQKSIIYVLILSMWSCQEEMHPQVSFHGDLIISKELYNTAKTDNYSIAEAFIIDDILHVTITSSGCDGNSWIVKLIDSGAIAESFPVQRFAKIALENKEICTSIPTKKFSINITPLKTDDDRITINLKGWGEQLLYK